MSSPTLDPSSLPRLIGAVPGPLSRAWLARLQRCESPNVTAVSAQFPVVWQAASGAVVRDVDGNLLLDATSAFGVALIGHNHPEVVHAVREQAGELLHGMGDVHPPAVRIALLEALQAIAPADLGYGVLCGGGSEAVEVAQKTALLATGKPGVVAFGNSYHGLGHGALGATGRRDFRDPFSAQLAHHVTWVPFADPLRPPVGVDPAQLASHLVARVAEHIDHPAMGGVPIGAVLVEPIQGRGGSIVPPSDFLPRLAELCRARGVLLIADEIFTGLGRTGSMWACQGVVPDILCVGKALGGGMPIAACLGRPAVMAAWGPSAGEALHTSTFLGNPVASAAALAALRVVARDDIPAQATAQGDAWLAGLEAALAGSAAVRQIRGRGLLMGIELQAVGTLTAGQIAWHSVLGALQRGLLVLPCGMAGETIQLTPPVSFTSQQRDFAIEALATAIAEASS